MIRIHSMYIAPVKALALTPIERGLLDKPGIAGDRAFYIINEYGEMFSQREHPALVQVVPAYDVASGQLTLTFPDGATVRGVPEPGEAVSTAFWGSRPVAGRVVDTQWNDALSEFVGHAVRLVKADSVGSAFDGFPLSMCSLASLGALAKAAEVDAVDGRRFRQNLYIEGTAAHGEDEWLGGEVRVGQAVVRVKMRDSRCRVTTQSPDTGEWDLNTLKIIASYRSDQPKEVNFGVYCTVAQPGEAAIGDEVAPVSVPQHAS
jgi:uncharacterized protein YcbX